MRAFICAAASVLFATAAYAQGASTASSSTCKANAAEKKLAGAALNSFMKKCENDAKERCTISSKEQKLRGAAATSHTKKCVSDAVGS